MLELFKSLFSSKNDKLKRQHDTYIKLYNEISKGQQQAAADKEKFENTPKYMNDAWGYAK